MKILLPVFEIKKNEAGKPKVLAAGRRRRGAEKRKEISLLSLSTQAPRAAGWEWKGRGSSEKQKTHVRESVISLWADIQERDR